MNPSEPKPEIGIPEEPPDDLHALGKEEYRRQLGCGVASWITLADLPVFTAFCEYYGRWQEVRDKVRQFGDLVIYKPERDEDGKIVKGEVQISQTAALERFYLREWTRLASELGLTPSSRSRVSTGEAPANTKDQIDRLLSAKRA